jgi:hypothetical protein
MRFQPTKNTIVSNILFIVLPFHQTPNYPPMTRVKETSWIPVRCYEIPKKPYRDIYDVINLNVKNISTVMSDVNYAKHIRFEV